MRNVRLRACGRETYSIEKSWAECLTADHAMWSMPLQLESVDYSSGNAPSAQNLS